MAERRGRDGSDRNGSRATQAGGQMALQLGSRRPAVAELDYHLARVLLLICTFAGPRGRLDGLTKLAKLDFLLRYPTFLERLLPHGADDWTATTKPSNSERIAVESRMVRYKYGPWDDRYYPIIGALVGRGLVTSHRRQRGQLALRPTAVGRSLAARLTADPAWGRIAARCALLREHFDIPGSRLKDLIYRQLPEVVERPYLTEI
jgi:hypothetical protein